MNPDDWKPADVVGAGIVFFILGLPLLTLCIIATLWAWQEFLPKEERDEED